MPNATTIPCLHWPHLHSTYPLRLVAVAMEAQVWCIHLTVLPYLLRTPHHRSQHDEQFTACPCMYGSQQEKYLYVQVVGPMAAAPPCMMHCSSEGRGEMPMQVPDTGHEMQASHALP